MGPVNSTPAPRNSWASWSAKTAAAVDDETLAGDEAGASDAKKLTACAMSSGIPMRPAGTEER